MHFDVDDLSWGILVAMRAQSARPLPIPKFSSAVATTLPALPAALSPVYTDVSGVSRWPLPH